MAGFTVNKRDAGGNLQPVSPRPEYVVVACIEPIVTNRGALGFDIYSNPARAVAIESARTTGRPTSTDLVQGSGTQKGRLRDGVDVTLVVVSDRANPARR